MQRLTPPEAIAKSPASLRFATPASTRRLTRAAGRRHAPEAHIPDSDANSGPQLELPFLSEAGRSDLKGPTQAPPGRLRHVQLTARVIPYWFRRARRRTIGIIVDEHGARGCGAALGDDRRDRGVHPREGALGAEAHRRGAARGPRAVPRGTRVRALPYLGREIALARTAWAAHPARRRAAGDLGARHSTVRLQLRDVVLEWLRRSALALYCERVAALGARTACRAPRSRLSNAASQWGSCTPHARRTRPGAAALEAGALRAAPGRLRRRARARAPAAHEPFGRVLARRRVGLPRPQVGAARAARARAPDTEPVTLIRNQHANAAYDAAGGRPRPFGQVLHRRARDEAPAHHRPAGPEVLARVRRLRRRGEDLRSSSSPTTTASTSTTSARRSATSRSPCPMSIRRART